MFTLMLPASTSSGLRWCACRVRSVIGVHTAERVLAVHTLMHQLSKLGEQLQVVQRSSSRYGSSGVAYERRHVGGLWNDM